MPKSFNFYQDNYTEGSTGIVPFRSFFSGIYFPLSTEEALKISLLEDDSSRPLNFLTIFSGLLDRELKDEKQFLFTLSGSVFPSESSSGELTFSYTGLINKDNIDTFYFLTPFNGKFSGDSIDINYISLSLTGEEKQTWNLISNFSFLTTGNCSGNFINVNEYYLNLSGKLLKKDQDTASMDFNFETITCDVGVTNRVITVDVSDNVSFDFNISNIIYQTA